MKQTAKDLYTFIAAQEIALIHFENLKSAMVNLETDKMIKAGVDEQTIVNEIAEYIQSMDDYVAKNKDLIARFVKDDDPLVTTFIDKFEYYLDKNIKIK